MRGRTPAGDVPVGEAEKGAHVTTRQKWEYKVVLWSSWDMSLLEHTLNDLGDEGWEVVATMNETLVLKRPCAGQEGRGDPGLAQE